jgi:hypothetical protein
VVGEGGGLLVHHQQWNPCSPRLCLSTPPPYPAPCTLHAYSSCNTRASTGTSSGVLLCLVWRTCRWREEGVRDTDVVTIRGIPCGKEASGRSGGVVTVSVRPDGSGAVHRVTGEETWQVRRRGRERQTE